MIRHKDSHLDHALTDAQIDHIFKLFSDRDSFFIETITLPPELGTVPCGLYGPLVGDSPIRDDSEYGVTRAPRGDRAWSSRLIGLPPRQQHEVTVIAGPHEETCPRCEGTLIAPYNCSFCNGTGKLKHACVLYTAFGGPSAPQEPGDPGCKDREASELFWRDHALAR